ncbi:RNA-binding protein 42-like, partial [Polypterus senegalus]|uniref:RNA-binding protein 42-like n=1 Tax=Polypterus senegalus TaxID=55291 RepID=UPI001963FCAC
MPRPPPPPPIMVGPPIPGSPPHHMGHMNPLTRQIGPDAPNGSCSQASGAASTKAHTSGNPGGSHRVYSPQLKKKMEPRILTHRTRLDQLASSVVEQATAAITTNAMLMEENDFVSRFGCDWPQYARAGALHA